MPLKIRFFLLSITYLAVRFRSAGTYSILLVYHELAKSAIAGGQKRWRFLFIELSKIKHGARPFQNAGRFPDEGSKKDPHPKKRPVAGIFGTKALKLLRCHPNWRFQTARSAARRHAPFLGNGGKARRGILGKHPVRPALSGPFNRLASAAISPPAALFENQGPAYSSASSVCAFELGHRIRLTGRVCQALKFISTDLTI